MFVFLPGPVYALFHGPYSELVVVCCLHIWTYSGANTLWDNSPTLPRCWARNFTLLPGQYRQMFTDGKLRPICEWNAVKRLVPKPESGPYASTSGWDPAVILKVCVYVCVRIDPDVESDNHAVWAGWTLVYTGLEENKHGGLVWVWFVSAVVWAALCIR